MSSTRLRPTLSALAASAALASPAYAQTFVWPISGTSTPDPMHTSFGPRIEDYAWDFHDGLDLPGTCGTPLKAVVDGQVVAASNANAQHSSRHVIIQTMDSNGVPLRAVYYHLASIDAALANATLPLAITRGTVIGTLGDDNAKFCHLHLEIRRNGNNQVNSVHPLHYLPYTDTANWTGPAAATARFNGGTGGLDARLVFAASSKLEGDLLRVEVDVRATNGAVLETRVVDFDDKSTISEGSDDTMMFNAQNAAVEGYQAPNMAADGRTDLQYGVLLRDLPSTAASLVARVYDVGGLRSTSAAIAVPAQAAFTESPALTSAPAGWTQIVQNSGVVSVASGVLTASDTTTSGPQIAAYERALPTNRFQWRATSTLKPTALNYANTYYTLPLYFGNGANLLGSARIRQGASAPVAGLNLLIGGGAATGKDSTTALSVGTARVWTLELTRLGTREATAVLRIDGAEVARLGWNAGATADKFRLGYGYSSAGAKVTFEQSAVTLTDEL